MRLKELRTQKHISQLDMAIACGVSQSSIVGYENGRCTPNPETLVKMAKALDCTVDELLTDPREKLEAELQAKIESGEMTADEAEDEYQNRYNPEPRYCGQEW